MSYIKYEVHEYSDGTKYWHLNGKLHREDGPAVEYSDGTKSWHLNGKLHREDGPAVEHWGGAKEWYLNDQLHREDGPAVEYWGGAKSWYLNGEVYSEFDYKAEMAKRNSIGASSCSGKTVTIDGKEYKLTEIK